MARQSKAIRFFDFTGGLNTKSPVTSLQPNQALDLDNIVLLPSGGFQKRRGNSAFNSSAMESGSAIHGLGYYRQADADEFLVSVVSSKVYSSPMTGTMTDRTGALSITAGGNSVWTSFVMNNNVYFVGGAPDAPFQWTGSGDATALAGSPPSGNFGFTHNRRAFIGNTTANPSRIAWSKLADPADWSAAGSGTQDIQEGDGDTLVCGVPISTDRVVLFKQNSIHNLDTTAAPFTTFPIARGVGCVGKLAWVKVNNTIYFITPQARMKAYDGNTITEFPDTIDNVWDGLSSTRRQYIVGEYNKRLNQIYWYCSNGSSSTNNYCIVWDITRSCWLRYTTGHDMNVTATNQAGTLYGGAYDGKIYQMDVSAVYTDASESSTAINGYWRSGWISLENMIESKYFPYLDVSFTTQSTGTLYVSYGFDFSPDRKTVSFSQQTTGDVYGTGVYGTAVYGGAADNAKLIHTKGQGKFFQFAIKNPNASEAMSINGLEIPIKVSSPTALI